MWFLHTMEKEENDRSTKLVDIIKFEIGAVRGNILMSADDKNAKIKQLKLLVPNCKDWKGLDEPLQERKISW